MFIKFPHRLFSICKLCIVAFCVLFLLNSCTKYVGKNSSQTNTSTGTSGSTQGATPTSGGNTSSGSSGTGSSSSGGNTGSSTGGSTGTGTGGSTSGGGTSTGGGSTGTGTGGSTSGNNNGSANIPQTYLQGFNYSNLANSSIYVNDSIQLLANGYYTSLKAGSLRFGLVWGNHNSTALANYFLNPYSFYSYFVFDETATTLGETILDNGSINTTTSSAQVRFINIDPTTKNSSITFKLNNGNDKLIIPNRRYLDNKTDSTLANFININPSTAVVEFEVNGQVIKSFNQYFQGGKKYTVLAAFSKQYNYSTYFVAQHN